MRRGEEEMEPWRKQNVSRVEKRSNRENMEDRNLMERGGQEEEEGGLHLLTVASPEALRRLRSEVEVMDLKEVSGSALLFLS